MKKTTVLSCAIAVASMVGSVPSLQAVESPESGEDGPIVAEEAHPTLNVAFDVRADYQLVKETHGDTSSGVHGRYLNVMVNGSITPQLTYSLRQRLNVYEEAQRDKFAGTDWVWLRYQPTSNWAIAGGKQVVLVGGYEYDAAPIDIFFASRFWNNIACYQFGGSVSYITNNGNHDLTFQVCNSPYQTIGNSCYAYNLYWSGRMGPLTTLWSVNMLEYERGRYANFIALGNRLHLGNFDLQLDLMNRATRHHKFIAGDYSVIAKAEVAVLPWMTLMAKGGYDEFKPLPGAPEHADNPFYGGGLEFYPLNHGSRDLRIHVIVDRVSDNAENRFTEVNVGVKWRVNLYSRN